MLTSAVRLPIEESGISGFRVVRGRSGGLGVPLAVSRRPLALGNILAGGKGSSEPFFGRELPPGKEVRVRYSCWYKRPVTNVSRLRGTASAAVLPLGGSRGSRVSRPVLFGSGCPRQVVSFRRAAAWARSPSVESDCGVVCIVGDLAARVESAWTSSQSIATRTGDPPVRLSLGVGV